MPDLWFKEIKSESVQIKAQGGGLCKHLAMLKLIVELIVQCSLRYRNRGVYNEIDGIQSLDEINRLHEP